MNSFWTGHGWELAEAGAICVLFLILGLWFGLRGRDRAYDDGYEDCLADAAEQAAKRLTAAPQPRAAALLAVAVREPEPPGLTAVREAGYAAWDRRAELWARQVEDPGEWAVPLEFPPALHDCPPDLCPHPAAEPGYEPAWEPWSLSEGTTVEEEVRAMIANANAAPSVRWLDSPEAAA
jgi:hypothetical protein